VAIYEGLNGGHAAARLDGGVAFSPIEWPGGEGTETQRQVAASGFCSNAAQHDPQCGSNQSHAQPRCARDQPVRDFDTARPAHWRDGAVPLDSNFSTDLGQQQASSPRCFQGS
jgi:hypothetical protein